MLKRLFKQIGSNLKESPPLFRHSSNVQFIFLSNITNENTHNTQTSQFTLNDHSQRLDVFTLISHFLTFDRFYFFPLHSFSSLCITHSAISGTQSENELMKHIDFQTGVCVCVSIWNMSCSFSLNIWFWHSRVSNHSIEHFLNLDPLLIHISFCWDASIVSSFSVSAQPIICILHIQMPSRSLETPRKCHFPVI